MRVQGSVLFASLVAKQRVAAAAAAASGGHVRHARIVARRRLTSHCRYAHTARQADCLTRDGRCTPTEISTKLSAVHCVSVSRYSARGESAYCAHDKPVETSESCRRFNKTSSHGKKHYKKFELMLTRRAKAYRSSGSVV